MSTKKDVLAVLEKNRSKYISGQELADMLDISRTSVWKAVKALEKDGHGITATPNKGYRLSDDSDVLSKEGILTALLNSIPEAPIEVLKTVDSTNTYAKKLALEGAPHGTLVLSEEQTAGRGRYGKSFFSPRGTGLYMSLVLRPDNETKDVQMITIAAAVNVCMAIESLTGLAPQIKWVNDVFLDGKKVCGILSEAGTDLESGVIEYIIVGIGINCTTVRDAYPQEIRGIVGSLGNTGVSRNELAAHIYQGIMRDFLRLSDVGLINEYRDRSLMYGRQIGFIYKGENCRGIVLDISDSGNLRVRCDNGEELTLVGGDVSIGSDFFGSDFR